MNEYVVKAPTPATCEGFEATAARHNGVFGGCACSWFHTLQDAKTFDVDDNVALTRRLVEESRAHAWLVYAGNEAVAWAECGSPSELPNIRHNKQAKRQTVIYHGTRALFVRAGSDNVRSESQGNCVMRRTV